MGDGVGRFVTGVGGTVDAIAHDLFTRRTAEDVDGPGVRVTPLDAIAERTIVRQPRHTSRLLERRGTSQSLHGQLKMNRLG